MTYPRSNPVVSKSVCTPVPPVAYGNAAGHARLAPPAFAPSKRAVRRLASGGSLAARLAARNNVQQMMRALAPRQGAGNQAFRPNRIFFEASGRRSFANAAAPRRMNPIFPRRRGALDSTAVSTQAAAWRKCAHNGTDRLSRVRNGCYSHTPPV